MVIVYVSYISIHQLHLLFHKVTFIYRHDISGSILWQRVNWLHVNTWGRIPYPLQVYEIVHLQKRVNLGVQICYLKKLCSFHWHFNNGSFLGQTVNLSLVHTWDRMPLVAKLIKLLNINIKNIHVLRFSSWSVHSSISQISAASNDLSLCFIFFP